jgi:3-phenylpropionate/trans-cinnamate dioxygenase ferredoxin reductase subunit
MSRAVAPMISEFFRELHSRKGITVICGATVATIEGANGNARSVVLNDGSKWSADMIIAGVGVLPNLELAQSAGLATANGIAIDEFLQTDDPDIFAVGDCAEFPCAFAGARIRLESVQNAADQAQFVAGTIAGRRSAYKALPWFWTDQFEVKLQMAGISRGHDRTVIRGTAESGKLSIFYFKGERLIGIDSINRPLDHMMGRKLMSAHVPLTPEQAADESFDLKHLAHSVGAAQH